MSDLKKWLSLPISKQNLHQEQKSKKSNTTKVRKI